MLRGVLLAAFALAGAAAAQPAAYDYARFALPDDWIRNDEQRFASYSPQGGGVAVSILTRFGDDDAEDTLEDFVERTEKGETSLDRSEPEDISNDDFDVYRQTTRSRAKDGRTLRRFYLAADKDDRATVVVIEGDEANYGRLETAARSIVSSLTLMDKGEGEVAPLVDLEERPGEGGLDGFFVATPERGYLDVGAMRWAWGERPEALYFDPLGGVYRGAPGRFDIDLAHTCVQATAWRCGRYRIEGGALVMRWADGTTERRSYMAEGEDLRIGGQLFQPAEGDGETPSGAFVYADLFNTGDWPPTDGDRKSVSYTIRFLEDGRFQLQGISGFRSQRAGANQSAAGRFKIAGHTLTLVYANGASEVVGFAQFPGDGARRLLIGGKVFAAP